MKCDSRASLLARTFTSLCLGCEPKIRVTTKLVIEILLNIDIQKKIVQMIIHFQKEINIIMYIIEKKTLIISFG
jgi:hypothetical protein